MQKVNQVKVGFKTNTNNLQTLKDFSKLGHCATKNESEGAQQGAFLRNY